MDLQVTKFIFENSLHLEETFFPCQCDIFHFFEFLLLGNSSTAPVFSHNQINKQPENLYVNYGECFVYFTQLTESSLFCTISVRAREETMETVYWHPQKDFNREKNPSRAHISGNRCKLKNLIKARNPTIKYKINK